MANLNIDALECGMVAAQDVMGSNGRLLLAAGTVLSASHLRVMRIWGVTEVEIETGQAECPEQGIIDPELIESLRPVVLRQFCLNDPEHPVVAELIRLRLGALAASGVTLKDKIIIAPEGELEPAAPDVKSLLGKDASLLSLPDVYFRLEEAMGDPACSAGKLAEIIGRDPGLAASLLKLANSPFYGFPQRIDSLSRGVMVIGAGELAVLALGVSVAEKFKGKSECQLKLRLMWEHAVNCGVMARVLAAHMGGQAQERVFVSGLLHDVGRLVMIRLAPAHMERVERLAESQGREYLSVEREVLGYDHCKVGLALLSGWKLPPQLCAAAGGHHSPVPQDIETCLVHVANVISCSLTDGVVAPLSCPAWDALGLPVSVLGVAQAQAARQVKDILSAITG